MKGLNSAPKRGVYVKGLLEQCARKRCLAGVYTTPKVVFQQVYEHRLNVKARALALTVVISVFNFICALLETI